MTCVRGHERHREPAPDDQRRLISSSLGAVGPAEYGTLAIRLRARRRSRYGAPVDASGYDRPRYARYRHLALSISLHGAEEPAAGPPTLVSRHRSRSRRGG